MKNTKHTENLDNSTPQEITSQSKRKILTSIGVSSGILGASALSQQWTKPIVNSIILPAHAQSTPMTTMAMGTTDMMGMPDPTTTMMPDPTTTMMPTTATPAMGPMIMLSTFPASQLMGDSLGVLMAAEAGMRKIRVALSVMPTAPVTVTLEGATAVVGEGTTLMFDDTDYMENQEIMLPTATPPTNMEGEKESMVTLTAKGGNYDEMEKELTYTVGYFGEDPVSEVKAARVGNGPDVKVSWMAPKTRAVIERYRITGGSEPMVAGMDATSHTVTGLTAGTEYNFSVTVDYKDGGSSGAAAADAVTA